MNRSTYYLLYIFIREKIINILIVYADICSPDLRVRRALRLRERAGKRRAGAIDRRETHLWADRRRRGEVLGR